jgi:hypothetical protein
MSEQNQDVSEQNQDNLIRAIYEHAATMMRAGVADDKIKADLVEKGMDTDSANTVVSGLAAIRTEQKKADAKKNILYGALWCGGGTAVTAATYAAAQGGGTYVITWGAIMVGGIQFVYGIFQYATA